MLRVLQVVNPLPETLLDYVWDYGTLNEEEEKRYISSMLQKQFEKMQKKEETKIPLGGDQRTFVEAFATMVVGAHGFLRRANGNEVSVVSLRDVARCVKLFVWFYHAIERLRLVADKKILRAKFKGLAVPTPTPLERSVKAMVLAVAHCYHFRLEEDVATYSRGEFRQQMAQVRPFSMAFQCHRAEPLRAGFAENCSEPDCQKSRHSCRR